MCRGQQVDREPRVDQAWSDTRVALQAKGSTPPFKHLSHNQSLLSLIQLSCTKELF